MPASGPTPRRAAVFLAQPKITEVRNKLEEKGIAASPAGGGVLVCANGLVRIRIDGQKIGIQGTMCAEYFRIRTLLYGLYKIL